MINGRDWFRLISRNFSACCPATEFIQREMFQKLVESLSDENVRASNSGNKFYKIFLKNRKPVKIGNYLSLCGAHEIAVMMI